MPSRAARGFLAAVLLLAFSFLPAIGGELQVDLKARRVQVMERLGRDCVFLLWSAPTQVYSRDVNYEYRQDSNFYYLTGIDQEESILMLLPGNTKRKEILFIKPRNPIREHWQGKLLSKEEATARSAIETVQLTTEFEPVVESLLSGRSFSSDSDAFSDALKAGRARLALVVDPRPGLSKPLTPTLEFANKAKERFFGLSLQEASDILRDLRQVKSPLERRTLERSVDISCEAHLAGMRVARPGAYEYQVKAAIEQVYKARGGLGWGYPSITGSGPNATILHYARSDRKLEAGDLLLVDAAGSYDYLTGDITRTYPVSGTFSEAQKEIYRIVLAAQEEAMKVAKAGAKIADVHAKTVEVIKQGLLKLGLITDPSGDQYRTWYTHGSVHYIGMDVHDLGDRNRPLEPGMAFVIEPGIYIQENALENLPNNPKNAEFIARVRPAFEKYKNIGVRIEDSFLLTESGLKHLSAKVPRTMEEIERFMKSGGR